MGSIRLLAIQHSPGAIHALAGLRCLRREGLAGGEDVHVVVHGLFLPPEQTRQLESTIRGIFAGEERVFFHNLTAFEARHPDLLGKRSDRNPLTPAELERLAPPLRRELGLQRVEAIHLVRNFQPGNQLLLAAYPEAHAIQYGDGWGNIDSRFGEGYRQTDEILTLLPHENNPMAMGSKPLRVVPLDLAREIIGRFWQGHGELARELRAYAEGFAGRAVLATPSPLSEYRRFDPLDELEIYRRTILENTEAEDCIVIKAHPRMANRQPEKLRELLSGPEGRRVLILPESFARYPVELLQPHLGFDKVLSFVSSTAIGLASIYGVQARIGFPEGWYEAANPEVRDTLAYNLDQKRVILHRLRDWDGRSPLYRFGDELALFGRETSAVYARKAGLPLGPTTEGGPAGRQQAEAPRTAEPPAAGTAAPGPSSPAAVQAAAPRPQPESSMATQPANARPEYRQEWYTRQGDDSYAAARVVLPLLKEWLPRLETVIDLGCGTGGFLAGCLEEGAQRVLGVDGPWVPRESLLVSPESFVVHDLATPLAREERYDLAVSLEVAEHLPPGAAGTIVATLCELAPVVLFGAALPYQGGEHHVNEQDPAYWADHFARRGYVLLDAVRPRVWSDSRMRWWHRQNTLLFVERSFLPGLSGWRTLLEQTRLEQLSLVHPERYRYIARNSELVKRDPEAAPPGESPGVEGQRALRGELLAEPEAEREAPRRKEPRISVVVPTRRNPELLVDVLETLSRQSLSAEQYEVIVVDNDSRDETPRIVERYPGVRYVHEKTLGLNPARNRGVAEAHAPIVAFTDDDVRVDERWLEELLAVYDADGEVWAVGGPLKPIWLAPRPDWLGEEYHRRLSLIDWGGETRELTWPERCIGANISFRREVFETFGLFDPNLDRVGGFLLDKGDTEIQMRLAKSDKKVMYAPRAVVHHKVPASRMTREYFEKRREGSLLGDRILALREQGRAEEADRLIEELRRRETGADSAAQPRPPQAPSEPPEEGGVNLIQVGPAPPLPAPWSEPEERFGTVLALEQGLGGEQRPEGISVDSTLWEDEGEHRFFRYQDVPGERFSPYLQNYDYLAEHRDELQARGPAELAANWLELSLPREVRRVRTTPLDAVLKALPEPGAFHLLRANLQGAELPVLRGARRFLEGPDCCALQLDLFTVPLFKGVALKEDVAAFLGELGYELALASEPHGPFASQQACLFLRTGRDDEAMSRIRRLYGLGEASPPAAAGSGSFAADPVAEPDTSGSASRQAPAVLHRERTEALLRSREALSEFRNRHRGQRCVIVGNGPSLNEMDLEWLNDEVTFGLNKIHLGFDRWSWRPSYHVSVNPLVLEQSAERFEELEIPSFVSINGYEHFRHPEGMIFLKSLQPPTDFSPDPRIGIWEGHTVTYVAMQLAWFMGFRDVALIGVDHNFAVKGPPNAEVVADRPDASHFDPGYFGPGTRWNLPDLEKSERAYRIAKQAFEADGRRIVNATVGGRLEIFDRVDHREWAARPPQGGNGELEAFQRALELNRQGEQRYARGDLEGALAFYREALEQRDDFPAAHNNIGVVAFRQGRHEEALNHLQRAVSLDAMDRNILLNISDILSSMGMEEQGREIIEDGARIFPDDPELAGAQRRPEPQ